jgi:hypothetical protein
MDINTYIQKPKSERQKHIDLTQACIRSVNQDGSQVSYNTSRTHAQKQILSFLNIQGKTDNNIHTCHKCDNSSSAKNGFVCVNPYHLYIGTSKENHHDIPETLRKEWANKGSIASHKSDKAKQARIKNGKKVISDVRKHLTTEILEEAGRNSVKKAIKSGNHMNQQKVSCKHCGKVSNPGLINRWHNDNCKKK